MTKLDFMSTFLLQLIHPIDILRLNLFSFQNLINLFHITIKNSISTYTFKYLNYNLRWATIVLTVTNVITLTTRKWKYTSLINNIVWKNISKNMIILKMKKKMNKELEKTTIDMKMEQYIVENGLMV